MGRRPDDSYWREFRGILGDRSAGNCWYCERRCLREADDGGIAPTVDHFRPLSRFPGTGLPMVKLDFQLPQMQLLRTRGTIWPDSGFVDPSAADEKDRPERFFDYDTATGEIIPMSGVAFRSPGESAADD